MNNLPDAGETRKPDHGIEPLLYRRWSPRAMSGEALTHQEIFAPQGTAMGLVVPKDYDGAAMFAAGRPGEPEKLPPELRERENPSDRRGVRGSIFEGVFVE